MTYLRRRLFSSSRVMRWRGTRAILLAAAVGFSGWQTAQFEWSEAGRALDQALWTHALEDRATVSDLQAAAPLWREREGASGDKIVERVDPSKPAKSSVAVLDEVSGHAIPAPVLAEQAAEKSETASLPVKPARFNGLTAGDRLTVTTTSGDVYTFEVVTGQEDITADGKIAIRVMAPDGDQGPVLYTVRPVTPGEPGALTPQQEL
ncbi:hypothetical protein [Dichotomicrobium thermohalophilum]|uniref:Uncharacterized protein n=1 Tax=Dichotomicrobium thermohalophilum TaxID=933063 RepID=A0A397PHD1_9HYPH|nr:hypothetical protein [Dichotomicrobium thermohalophilum]RIA47289.1 hypothetical protein BXY53_2672 [Dichotomicrobium thermohalophilum]